jgi:hypothetical protein
MTEGIDERGCTSLLLVSSSCRLKMFLQIVSPVASSGAVGRTFSSRKEGDGSAAGRRGAGQE